MHGNISSSYTKDGWFEDSTPVDIICVSDDYGQTVEIAEAVRELLVGSTEDQIENVFVQRLSFDVKVTAF